MTFNDITRDDLLSLQSLTGFDFLNLYQRLVSFFNATSGQIKRQYKTGTRNNPEAFNELKEIEIKVREAIDLFTKNREVFQDFKHWIILDDLEDSLNQFSQLNNYHLWARNNALNNSISGKNEIDYVLNQGETLEDVERKVLSQDPDESWYELALRNNLKEEDYSTEGGTPLKVIFRGNGSNTFIRTTIDVIDKGEKIYGKDFDRKLQYVNNDLKVLDNLETKLQSVEILTGLRKGSNPSKIQDGIDYTAIVGSNKSSILFPSIFRQLAEVIRTDDSFSGIQIKKIDTSEDALFVEFDLFTRFNEVENGTIKL